MKGYYRFEMDLKFLNIFTILLFVICYIFMLLAGYNIWNIEYGKNIILFMFIWFLFHEVIHGIGFSLLDKKDLKKIVFGIELEKGIFYCMCKQRLSKANIILALLLPLILIGFITLILGLLLKSNLLLFLSIINISGSSADIAMTIAILKMKNVEYLDTDDTTGFYILSNEDISNKKYLGLKIKETGIYNSDKIVAKDYTKIKISKISWYIIIGIIVYTALLNIL